MTVDRALLEGRARVRPLPAPGLVLLVAVAAMSWSGPLVKLSEAPALAISAWRLIFSVGFIAAVLAWRGGRPVRLEAREWILAVVSGALLAGHFWAWIASVELTTVSSSVVLVSVQTPFVAVLSIVWLGERPGRRHWLGIGAAVVGAATIGWGDFGRGGAAIAGDLLALAGAAFVAGYFVAGRRLRARLDLWTYTGVVYGVAAAILALAVVAHPGVDLTGYAPREWGIFLALAAGPMLLGHSGVNYALRYVPAYVANLAVLGEPVGATLLAWVLPGIGEAPHAQTLVGGALILCGIAVGARRER